MIPRITLVDPEVVLGTVQRGDPPVLPVVVPVAPSPRRSNCSIFNACHPTTVPHPGRVSRTNRTDEPLNTIVALYDENQHRSAVVPTILSTRTGTTAQYSRSADPNPSPTHDVCPFCANVCASTDPES